MRPTRIVVDDWSAREKAQIASLTPSGRAAAEVMRQAAKAGKAAGWDVGPPPQPSLHPSGLNRKQRRKYIGGMK
jgi:hypothetical protein